MDSTDEDCLHSDDNHCVNKSAVTAVKADFVKVTLVRKLLVNDYGTEFHKNWVNGLVVDGRSQTDGRDFHIKAFFSYFIKNA